MSVKIQNTFKDVIIEGGILKCFMPFNFVKTSGGILKHTAELLYVDQIVISTEKKIMVK